MHQIVPRLMRLETLNIIVVSKHFLCTVCKEMGGLLIENIIILFEELSQNALEVLEISTHNYKG